MTLHDLEIRRFEPGAFRDPRQHTWPDFLAVMKCEYEVRPAFARENFVGTGLAFNSPADLKKSSKNSRSTRARPRSHAAANVMVVYSEVASPCSS